MNIGSLTNSISRIPFDDAAPMDIADDEEDALTSIARKSLDQLPICQGLTPSKPLKAKLNFSFKREEVTAINDNPKLDPSERDSYPVPSLSDWIVPCDMDDNEPVDESRFVASLLGSESSSRAPMDTSDLWDSLDGPTNAGAYSPAPPKPEMSESEKDELIKKQEFDSLIKKSGMKLVCKIAEGRRASVYKVTDNAKERVFSIKVWKPCISKERVDYEILLLKELSSSPYFVDFQGCCDVDKATRTMTCGYFVRNLRQRIGEGNLPRAKIKNFTMQILLGLNALNKRLIVHGNLTSENILLDADDRIHIGGFGSSFSVGNKSMWESLEPSAYGSVASHLLGQKPSARTDLWSLGSLIVEMMTGKPFLPDTGQFPSRHHEMLKNMIRVMGPAPLSWRTRRVYQSQKLFLEDFSPEEAPGNLQKYLKERLDKHFVPETGGAQEVQEKEHLLDLLVTLLAYESKKTPKVFLEHPYFKMQNYIEVVKDPSSPDAIDLSIRKFHKDYVTKHCLDISFSKRTRFHQFISKTATNGSQSDVFQVLLSIGKDVYFNKTLSLPFGTRLIISHSGVRVESCLK